eukprot:3170873-Rhodomonas_salina.6
METGRGHRKKRKGTSGTAGRSRKLTYEPSGASGEPAKQENQPYQATAQEHQPRPARNRLAT